MRGPIQSTRDAALGGAVGAVGGAAAGFEVASRGVSRAADGATATILEELPKLVPESIPFLEAGIEVML